MFRFDNADLQMPHLAVDRHGEGGDNLIVPVLLAL